MTDWGAVLMLVMMLLRVGDPTFYIIAKYSRCVNLNIVIKYYRNISKSQMNSVINWNGCLQNG